MLVREKCSFWEDSWDRHPLIDNNLVPISNKDKLIKCWVRVASEYKIKDNTDNQLLMTTMTRTLIS